MRAQLESALDDIGLSLTSYEGKDLSVTTPIDGDVIASLAINAADHIAQKITNAQAAQRAWQSIPAPKRGELVRVFAQILRDYKEPLAQIVTLECGKILEEARGEVQEMIDICDFAVGLSRTVGGLTLPSERPEHVMEENWYPLGVVGIISAFNFPVAVWAWNAALALVCGNAILWKPSELTPICAIACQHLFEKAIKATDVTVPEGLSQIIIAGREGGEALVDSPAVSLVSATGSCAMGRIVGPKVAERFGRSLLELGGNNAVIITPSAAEDITLPSLIFGAVGTAGQRCTTTRRAFIHVDSYDHYAKQLVQAYEKLGSVIGNPLEPKTLIGPLIHQESYEAMQQALREAKKQGATIHGGERVSIAEDGYYVQPAVVFLKEQTEIVLEETFAPILYVIPYKTLEDAMVAHNQVPQGLSSAIFTQDVSEAYYFKQHSDCGIANVNIGTSGAEIGGAFGGEKATGGGRESGSDSWKAYMRRQTSTTYFGKKPPALAQGIEFSL